MLDQLRCIASLTLMLSICLCNPYPGVAQQLALKANSFPKVLSALEDSSGNFLLLKLDSKTPLTAPRIQFLPGMEGQTVMVAEFENLLWLNSSQLFEPQYQEIDSIRLGQFQTNPPIFRISIATSNPAVLRKIEFQNTGSALVIRLRAPKSGNAYSAKPAGALKSMEASYHPNTQAMAAAKQSAKSIQPPNYGDERQTIQPRGVAPQLIPVPTRRPLSQSTALSEGKATQGAHSETDPGVSSKDSRQAASARLPLDLIPNTTNGSERSTATKNPAKTSQAKLPFTGGGLLLQAKSHIKQSQTQTDTVEPAFGQTASTTSLATSNSAQQQQQQQIIEASSSKDQFALRGPIEIEQSRIPAAAPSFKAKNIDASMPVAAPDLGRRKQGKVDETKTVAMVTSSNGMPSEAPDLKTKNKSVSNLDNENVQPRKASSAARAIETTTISTTIESTKPSPARTVFFDSFFSKKSTSSSSAATALPADPVRTELSKTAEIPKAAPPIQRNTQVTVSSTTTKTTTTVPPAAQVSATTSPNKTTITSTSTSTSISNSASPLAKTTVTSTSSSTVTANSEQMPNPAPPINGQGSDATSSAPNPQVSIEGRNPIALRFRFKEPVQYTCFKLDDPPRYVIDLAIPASDTQRNALTADKNDFLRGIRFGTPDEEAKTTRIVLDLEKVEVAVKDEIDSTHSMLTITLQTGTGAETTVTNVPGSVKGKLVVIDPGHGGSDPGAQRGDNNEKDMTLAIAVKLKQVLQEQGIRTVMTRTDDTFVSLEDRVRITNATAPDAFVSVHINSLETDRDIQGIETYYQTEQSKILANKIHENLVGKLVVPDRNVRKARFYVINHTPHPAVLAEVGFISNKTERDKLISSDYQLKVADSIGQGVILFLSGSTQMPPIASKAVLPGSQASTAAITSSEKQSLAKNSPDVVKRNLAANSKKDSQIKNNHGAGNKRIAGKVTDQSAPGKQGTKKRRNSRQLAARRS